MILFKGNNNEFYNKLIHLLFDEEVYNKNVDTGDVIEKAMPKYLRREQFLKCEKVFKDIYDWSTDDYNHEIASFHKLVIYKFIEYLKEKIKHDLFFQTRFKILISNTIDIVGLKKIKNEPQYYDINWYLDNLFEEIGFLIVDKFDDNNKLIKYLSENKKEVDLYYDILPYEVQKKFENSDTIFNEIQDLLYYFDLCLKKGNLSMMFWENEKPMKERQVQVVLENLIDAYFYNQDIDITRETLVGSGNIDFRFYRNENEKILVEIKKADSSQLKHGYEKQLINYMKSEQCKQAFYLIICFNDCEYNKARKFVEKHVETDIYHKYIRISILDVRTKDKKINFLNALKLNENIPMKIDTCFRHINKFAEVSNTKDVLKFLKRLKNNYEKIDDLELKKLYLKKVQEILSHGVQEVMITSIFSKEFYKIIPPEKAPRVLAMTSILTKTEEDFIRSINSVIGYYELIDVGNPTDRINDEQIREIFNFLKCEFEFVYRIIEKLNLKIFMFDNIQINSDVNIIPTLDITRYNLVCFYVSDNDKRDVCNPIYLFFYQIGAVLSWIAEEKCPEMFKLFAKILDKDYEDFLYNDLEYRELFSSSFAGYIMHSTTYEKYSPYEEIADKFYEIWDIYYRRLCLEINLRLGGK